MNQMEILKNSQGKVLYGMHFYPGVAEYQEPGSEPFRVFLNEDTIRSMDPSFAGRPIFVEHVDSVEKNIDDLRKEADGWVIESFYNSADGKHWVKFIVVSEDGERAIKNGMRLSNAYTPKTFGAGGLWNGVSYSKEITSGEYEHLAIVNNPRYEESVILTPEEFKKYNEEKVLELKKLSNNKERESKMKFNFFKRSKVQNEVDPEVCVILPKSGKEYTLAAIINAMDEKEVKMHDEMADMSHKVKMHDGSMCNVAELLDKHKAMKDELEGLKAKKEDSMVEEKDLKVEDMPVDSESTPEMKNEEEDKKKDLQLFEHEEKEVEEAKKKNEIELKKAKAKEKADALRNAHLRPLANEEVTVQTPATKVQRGKARYGSGN